MQRTKKTDASASSRARRVGSQILIENLKIHEDRKPIYESEITVSRHEGCKAPIVRESPRF